MTQPIAQKEIDDLLSRLDARDLSRATIRQSVAVTNALEQMTGEKFSHLEIGVPGLPPCQVGVDAQKAALDRHVSSIYPPIGGIAPLKENAARFVEAFVGTKVTPECVVPTVGSMQGCFNLLLEGSRLDPKKDTILFLDPGFPAQHAQANVLGIPSQSFDLYQYRAEKLGPKLEEYFKQGNIAAILESNPNDPACVCRTDEELRTIGELATKYDVIVLEDMAYMCMDFRQDLSHPFQPPYQASVSHYTDNYVMMMSASKIFSYAGERLGIVVFSPALFNREYPHLRELYGMGRMGDNYILTFLYVASSGTSHSAQHAVAAMLGAAADGTLDFVDELEEYGRRARIVKELFTRNGFHIIYDRDNDRPIGDGFFFTVGYGTMNNRDIITNLMRCGVATISLLTAYSEQSGVRVCVSALSTDEQFQVLDQRLKMFNEYFKDCK